MRVYKIHADKEKNTSYMSLYYIRAKSKKQAKELFKSFFKGMNIFSVDECSEKEVEDVIATKKTPILGLTK